MTLEEVRDKKEYLNKELDLLIGLEKELLFGEYKKNEGKFFVFDKNSLYENTYIQIDSIWGNKREIIIEGTSFNQSSGGSADCVWFNFEGFRQFQFNTEFIHSWEDFHLKEITKKEFKEKFYEAYSKCASDFDRYYKQ